MESFLVELLMHTHTPLAYTTQAKLLGQEGDGHGLPL